MIHWNGSLVGIIPDLSQLAQQGQTFRLPDSSKLSVEPWYTGSVLFDFNVFLNDQLLTHRRQAARSLILSSCIVLFVAGINLLVGLLYLSNSLPHSTTGLVFLCAGLSSLAFRGTAVSIIASAIYLVLGLRIWQHSWLALVTALGMLFFDSAHLVLTFLRGGGEAAVFVYPLFISRFILLVLLAVGLGEFEGLGARDSATSNFASHHTLALIKQRTAKLLALLIDPISWIFYWIHYRR